MPNGYTRTQIVLHWLVFVLIVLQFVLHDGIAEAFRVLLRTGEPQIDALVAQHVFGGVLILILVIWRLVLKRRRGAPALPENEPAWLKFTAHATHYVLYLLLVLVPVSGLVAWFGAWSDAGEAHKVLKTVLLVVVVLHFAGALFQRFVLKSDVMQRMFKAVP